jgi:hypothetical protein
MAGASETIGGAKEMVFRQTGMAQSFSRREKP